MSAIAPSSVSSTNAPACMTIASSTLSINPSFQFFLHYATKESSARAEEFMRGAVPYIGISKEEAKSCIDVTVSYSMQRDGFYTIGYATKDPTIAAPVTDVHNLAERVAAIVGFDSKTVPVYLIRPMDIK